MESLSPAHLAEGVDHALARYVARLSPGRKSSLTTIAAKVLFTALAEDLRTATSMDPVRRTTLTRHSLRERVRTHEDFPSDTLYASSFNTTPEELAGLLEKFKFEDEWEGQRWTLRFAGPTLQGRHGRGTKEELYLLVDPRVVPTDSAPRIDAPLTLTDRYRELWLASESLSAALRATQTLFAGLNVLKLIYLEEAITLEIAASGDAKITQRIRAANVGSEPLTCEAHELWFETPQPSPFRLSVLTAPRWHARLETQRDFPNYKQYLLQIVRPIQPLETITYTLAYSCEREFVTRADWDLKIRRFITRLRLDVRDHRPGRLRAMTLTTESPVGRRHEESPAITMGRGRGTTRWHWEEAVPNLDTMYRFQWELA